MYIFRFPAKAHEVIWTYDGLSQFIARGQRPNEYRKIGTTLTVERAQIGGAIVVRLYDTVIASFIHNYPKVWVPSEVDSYRSQATREWLSLILGKPVFSENFVYYTDFNRKSPVAGCYHPERDYT